MSANDTSSTTIFFARYAGSQYRDIDQLQLDWEKSLISVLGDKIQMRLENVILCCREAILNAQVHGCGREEDKFCTLKINYLIDKNKLMIQIDDPGQGHHFNIQERRHLLQQNPYAPNCGHLGLVIVSDLANHTELLHNGATIIMAFNL